MVVQATLISRAWWTRWSMAARSLLSAALRAVFVSRSQMSVVASAEGRMRRRRNQSWMFLCPAAGFDLGWHETARMVGPDGGLGGAFARELVLEVGDTADVQCAVLRDGGYCGLL